MKNLCVAVVVMRSVVGKIDKNIKRTKYWINKANKLGAGIVCFPELNITGYSNNYKNVKSLAISLKSKYIKSLLLDATETGMIIMPGIIEKGTSGEIYITHIVIAPKGIIGVYRKTHLPDVEKEVFTNGSYSPVFQTRKVNIGLQLCYDAHFPELSTCMSLGGAEIIFIPHASPRGTAESKHYSWLRHLTARAFDNGVFVIACNQVGSNGEGLLFPGNALAISPLGKVIGKKISGNEGILILHLEAKQIADVHKHKMCYFLPKRRPELYKNSVLVKHPLVS